MTTLQSNKQTSIKWKQGRRKFYRTTKENQPSNWVYTDPHEKNVEDLRVHKKQKGIKKDI